MIVLAPKESEEVFHLSITQKCLENYQEMLITLPATSLSVALPASVPFPDFSHLM